MRHYSAFLSPKRREDSTEPALLPVFFPVHKESRRRASRKSVPRIFSLAICCAALVSASAQVRSQRLIPDVFLITIDTLRADHVHCYGYEKVGTPALDSLAKEGILFAQAFTPSPITNTSHTTILTGLLPSTHGVTDFAVPLAVSHPTWAELLKQKRYHTAAFIGAVILDSKSLAPGLDRGFDFYDNFPEHSQSKARWGRVERRGMDVVQHAEKWLSAHPAGPHFVWLHLYDPHDPYEAPAPYDQKYKDRPYDGEIAYADSALSKFLSFLKLRGWYQNSIIVVVGDHGEGLKEHDEDTHGIFLYDSTIHVPLILRLPGAQKTHVVDAQVRTTDILPTVLDLLKIPAPIQLDGESLKTYVEGAQSSDRVAFGETDYPLRFGWASLRSVRADGAKFIQAPRPELYDLRSDPGELKNKYQTSDPAAQKFKTMLSELKPKAAANPPSDAQVPQAATSNLNALGYASAAGTPATSGDLPDPKDKIEEQNLLHLAMIAADDNRSADARAALEKVLRLDEKSPTALRQLGELEVQAGEYTKAAEHLQQAIKVRPNDATASFEAAQALQKIGNLAGARDALESSLKSMPGQFPARLLLGQVYLDLKDLKNAQDQLEAALLLQPNSVDAQLALAQAQIAGGNFAEAVQQLQPLTKSQPGNAKLFELLAQAYNGAGKTEEARQAEAVARRLKEK
jgi:choline-sulfatase